MARDARIPVTFVALDDKDELRWDISKRFCANHPTVPMVMRPPEGDEDVGAIFVGGADDFEAELQKRGLLQA